MIRRSKRGAALKDVVRLERGDDEHRDNDGAVDHGRDDQEYWRKGANLGTTRDEELGSKELQRQEQSSQEPLVAQEKMGLRRTGRNPKITRSARAKAINNSTKKVNHLGKEVHEKGSSRDEVKGNPVKTRTTRRTATIHSEEGDKRRSSADKSNIVDQGTEDDKYSTVTIRMKKGAKKPASLAAAKTKVSKESQLSSMAPKDLGTKRNKKSLASTSSAETEVASCVETIISNEPVVQVSKRMRKPTRLGDDFVTEIIPGQYQNSRSQKPQPTKKRKPKKTNQVEATAKKAKLSARKSTVARSLHSEASTKDSSKKDTHPQPQNDGILRKKVTSADVEPVFTTLFRTQDPSTNQRKSGKNPRKAKKRIASDETSSSQVIGKECNSSYDSVTMDDSFRQPDLVSAAVSLSSHSKLVREGDFLQEQMLQLPTETLACFVEETEPEVANAIELLSQANDDVILSKEIVPSKATDNAVFFDDVRESDALLMLSVMAVENSGLAHVHFDLSVPKNLACIYSEPGVLSSACCDTYNSTFAISEVLDDTVFSAQEDFAGDGTSNQLGAGKTQGFSTRSFTKKERNAYFRFSRHDLSTALFSHLALDRESSQGKERFSFFVKELIQRENWSPPEIGEEFNIDFTTFSKDTLAYFCHLFGIRLKRRRKSQSNVESGNGSSSATYNEVARSSGIDEGNFTEEVEGVCREEISGLGTSNTSMPSAIQTVASVTSKTVINSSVQDIPVTLRSLSGVSVGVH